MMKKRAGRPRRPPATRRTSPSGTPRAAGSFPIVGVGASAGGLEAFTALLKHLPVDTGMGFVLVQHLDPVHESALAHLLGRATTMPVREVTNNLRVKPNHVYVIPPNANLSIVSGVLTIGPRPKTRAPHRSIDFFFESLASDRHERAIGIVLSGTATDGTVGLEAIKAEGGITFAQDDSARYDSMPKSAVAAGCVDLVLSPKEIAGELARIAKHPAVAGGATAEVSAPGLKSRPTATPAEDDRASATEHAGDDTALPSGGRGTPRTDAKQARAEAVRAQGEPALVAENGFKKVLLLLRNHCGVDFSLYKSSTIQRRVTRRAVLTRHETLDQYAQFLRGNTKELDALYSDTLISVTSFFRNPDAFDVLQRKVWPAILRQRGDDPVRVWVLGCSTGQEAYSIAMSFAEAAEKAARMRKLQVFATDLNDSLLDKARHGLYAKSLAQDLSPERLRRFFVEEEGGYRITKALREMVVFARQNLIGDPPFSRMDLISCRNLLIYFEPALQKKVFPVFHYALRTGGFLYLGASESIGGFTELFDPVDKKHRIYARKAAPTQALALALALPVRKDRGDAPRPGSPRAGNPLLAQAVPGGADEALRGELSAQREADRVTVNQFAPPAVLINAELQILQFRGATSAYLEPPTGKASFDVLKMARQGLMLPLRAAINTAKKENRTARKDNLSVEQDGEARTFSIEVIPLKNLRERCFLIVFEDAKHAAQTAAADVSRGRRRPLEPPATRAGRTSARGESRRATELETELAETRDFLQAVQEQHDAANEELQASNEEVQSANEELQSINEELETSKEELESANEELTTLNDEMGHRNTELTRLNSDLKRTEQAIAATRDYANNIIETVREPLVVLSADLRVESVNRSFCETFRVTSGETVGRLIYDLPDRQWDIPELRRLLDKTLSRDQPIESFQIEHDFASLGRRTLVLNARRMQDPNHASDLILLAIEDITERTKAGEERAWLAAIVSSTDDAVVSKTLDGIVISWNDAAERMFGYSAAEAVGQHISFIIPEERRGEDNDVLARLRRGERVDPFETERQAKDGHKVSVSLTVSPIVDGQGQVIGASKVARDITERTRTEALLRSQKEALEMVASGAPLGDVLDFLARAVESQSPHGMMAAIHLLDPAGTHFTTVSAPSLPAAYLDATEGLAIDPRSGPCCNAVLSGEAVGVADVAHDPRWPRFTEFALPCGIRAGWSTPIFGSGGKVVGTFASYYREPRTPGPEDEQLLGIITRTVAVAIDRTQAEQALRASAERYRTLFNSIDEGFCVIEKVEGAAGEPLDFRYVEANPAFAAHAGVSGVVGKTIRQAFPGEPEEWFLTYDAIVRTGEPVKFERGLVTQGRVLDLFAFRVEDETHRRVAVIFKDITERKQAEDALREADRRKTEFLALLAHELRNPLAPIRVAVDILRRTRNVDSPASSSSADSALNTLERQVTQMVRLVDDLLDAGRISMGKMELRRERPELSTVMHDALDMVRPFCENGDHALTVALPPDPVYVNADPARLAQIVGNLLINACKFSEKGSGVWLTVEASDAAVVVRVRDRGVGIAADQLARIFDMFVQVDSSLSRSAAGLGIGLTLVKTLVQMHGGTIEVRSDGIGQGSEFVVRLPIVVHAPALPTTPAAPEPVAPTALRILVVDDSRDAAESLTLLLGFSGHETHVAHDGLEAVTAADRLQPDVILLDIGLPGLDGYEAARRIRQQQKTQRPLLVALTGWGQDEDRQRSEEAGFDAHLVKPVDDGALTKLLFDLGAGNPGRET